MNKKPLVLLAVAGLGGCSLLDLATDERPHGAQRDAISDLFEQTAAVATTVDDPDSADASDLATMMSFDHFVALADPDVVEQKPRRAQIAKALECLQKEGTTWSANACAVVLPDGRACVVDGSIVQTAVEGGFRYDGSATMSGEGCPFAQLDVDVTLEGPSDSPTHLTGTLAIATEDGDTDFSGSASLDLGISGDCDVPSEGTIDVDVNGQYAGQPIDGAVTLAFHETPECGYITLE